MNTNTKTSLKIYKQTKVIIEQVCKFDLIKASRKEETNPDAETAITELVAIYMRDIIRENTDISEKRLIDQAISKAEVAFEKFLIKNEVNDNDASFKEIKKYLTIAKRNLERKPKNKNQFSFAQGVIDARTEKSPLQLEIKVSESKDEIYSRLQAKLTPLLGDNLRLKRLKLIKIGFDNYIEGLLIYPQLEDLEEFTIETDNLPEGFEVGESIAFPVEIKQKNFLYILDDDGSIFVNVENLTDESFKQAGTFLIQLGMALYNKLIT